MSSEVGKLFSAFLSCHLGPRAEGDDLHMTNPADRRLSELTAVGEHSPFVPDHGGAGHLREKDVPCVAEHLHWLALAEIELDSVVERPPRCLVTRVHSRRNERRDTDDCGDSNRHPHRIPDFHGVFSQRTSTPNAHCVRYGVDCTRKNKTRQYVRKR